MSALQIKSIVVEADIGVDIPEAIKAAIELSMKNASPDGNAPPVRFDFNGVTVKVTARSVPAAVYDEYRREMNRRAENYRRWRDAR